ncbi:multicopper oxidase domain-containing protein [Limnochorda pilosa]|uniref:Multicopper oxidase n=1 Tax=Limnochorda pilosa TaxID=1555112 RepID=A0A0K2SI15_LIMPI|nr:multicopper oxidase domain-containing protein [Limnochorda pilosa]BAS26725.1 multicopper oxidase [Limnochorda pilosa]
MRKDLRLGATDGWVRMPDGSSHYIFGFVEITGVPEKRIWSDRGKAELPGPLVDAGEGDDIYLTLTNLGLPQRPDLDDSHTIHWHGFPNQIPLYDGVPEVSISVPVGRDFTYYFKPQDPGTYMYHCHFEPAEHIQMGMVGPVIVRPALERDPAYAGRKFAYDDPSTEYDREYVVFLMELDPVGHDLVANVQEYDWTDYRPKYWLLNGRAYPDTVEGESQQLPQQPWRTCIRANVGERVLLRFINLGYEEHAMEILGIPVRIVGLDAQRLRGLGGEDLAAWRNVVPISPGQTVDALFTAPAPGQYPFYNRGYHKNVNAGAAPGGMIATVQVHRHGTLQPQREPNR